MNTELLWGLALIFFGISIVLKVIFGIAIPTLRLIAGGILIYTGLSIIMDTKDKERTRSKKKESEITVLFQSQTINWHDYVPNKPTERIINIVCGSAALQLNPDIPTQLDITSVASRTELPDGSISAFGTQKYKTHPDKKSLLYITAHVTAGNLQITAD